MSSTEHPDAQTDLDAKTDDKIDNKSSANGNTALPLQNEQLIVGLKLALICAVSALLLAVVNAFTGPVIEQNRQRQLEENLAQILPPGNQVVERIAVEEREDIVAYFPLVDELTDRSGYIVQLIGQGYSGDMTVLAGFRTDGQVFAARLLENAETPGVGKKAEDPEYMDMFVGSGSPTDAVPTSKRDLSPDDATEVSGATITFIGISEALDEGADFVRQLPARTQGSTVGTSDDDNEEEQI